MIDLVPKLSNLFERSTNLRTLELKEFKNKLAYMKDMFVLKLPHFFPHLHGKVKSAAISKKACFNRIESVLILSKLQLFHKKSKIEY